MYKIAEEQIITLKKQKEHEDEAKKNLLIIAHKRYEERMETIRKQRKSIIDEDLKRKRLVFENLRQQVCH